MMQGEFTFDDFLRSYKMLRRMGPLQGVLKMIPGMGKQLEGLDDVDERQLARVEAIVLSMTPQRAAPAARDRRLAPASGSRPAAAPRSSRSTSCSLARKQMAKMMKQIGKGKMPALPGMPGGAAGAGSAMARRAPQPRRGRASARRSRKSRR